MRNTIHRVRTGALALLVSLTAGCAANDIPLDAPPADMLRHAEERLSRGKYLDAAETLEHFLRSYPGTAQTPLAKLRLGDARFGIEEFVLARGAYEDVVQDYPASPYVEEARFKITRSVYRTTLPHNLDQSDTERAIELLETFGRDFPTSRYQEDVHKMLADCHDRLARREFEAGLFYEKQRRYRPAKSQYAYVIDTYAETEWACRALYQLAEMYRSHGRNDEAVATYQQYLTKCSNSSLASMVRDALDELTGGEQL